MIEMGRNELLAQAVDRAVLKGLMRPSAATDLVLLYRNECVVESDNDRVTLHGKDLDAAVAELIKARPHWQNDKPKTNSIDMEVERAALLADHKNWSASEKPPVSDNKGPKPTNPWSKQSWNLSNQMRLIKAIGMEKATEIAKAAGSYPGAAHPTEEYGATNNHVDAIADRAHDKSNPWTREGWNLTQQGVVYKKVGREKAAELAEAAGVRLGATRPA
jgi:hypothetical protein